MDWTHNESLHSKQKNQEQKTWCKEKMSFSPPLPQYTEKDASTKFIFPILYHAARPMEQPFACLPVFLGALFNSKNSLVQSNTRAQRHFSSIFIPLTLSNTSRRAAHWSATGESYGNGCQLRMVPDELNSPLIPKQQ